MRRVSIAAFSLEDKAQAALNSPRSLEACARHGILPEDLLHKKKAYFRKLLGGSAPAEVVKLYRSHYNERRASWLELLKQEYARILKEETQPARSSLMSSPDKNRNLIEAEKKKIALIEKKQAQEVQQAKERERLNEEIRKRNEEKEKAAQKREAFRNKQLALAQKARDEKRRKDDEAKRLKEAQEEAELQERQRLLQRKEEEKRQLHGLHLAAGYRERSKVVPVEAANDEWLIVGAPFEQRVDGT